MSDNDDIEDYEFEPDYYSDIFFEDCNKVCKKRKCPDDEHLENKQIDFENLQVNRRKISKTLFFDLNLSDHHILPFNDCISIWLRDIILNHGNIETIHNDTLYTLTLSNYRFIRGSILPSDAHLYNISYAGDIFIDIIEIHYLKDKSQIIKRVEYKDIILCSFPIMLYSAVCHFSEGNDLSNQTEPEYAGGFIVKGKRRYIPLLKSLVNNYPFRFFNKNKQTYTIQVRSEHLNRKHRSTSTLELVINADKPKRSHVFHNVIVKVPFLTPTVPITILMLAFGLSIEEFQNNVKSSIGRLWDDVLFYKYFIMLKHDHHGCVSKEDALCYIGKLYGKVNNTTTAEHIIKSEILPHMNDDNDDTLKRKGYYIAYIYGLLILFKEGKIPATDRDSRIYTRIIDSGTSLAFLFRMLFLNFMKQGLKIMRRVLNQDKQLDINKVYNSRRLTQKIMSALATGTWSKQRKGVSHPMTTTNEQAIISQLRRISSSYLNNEGKHLGPRMVHESACGYECAAETPESESCGLVYSLASLARVTRASDSYVLMSYIAYVAKDIIIPYNILSIASSVQWYKIFDSNGKLFGWCTNIDALNKIFVNARRKLIIDPFATIHQDKLLKEWRIYCDIGRMVRPLIVIENLYKVNQLINECPIGTSILPILMSNGCLEYVSSSEELNLSVTFRLPTSINETNKYSHLEVNDYTFVGIIAALAPFFRHNQGPRLVYWISMCKQAIGSTLSRDMGSATTHNLWYGQKPLVVTQTARDLNMDQIPDCINVTIIFFPHSSNQEDAIVINRAAIDRGLFISDSIRTYTSEKDGDVSDLYSEKFERPTVGQTFGMKNNDYTKLQSNGLPLKGTIVNGGDVIIGKTVPIKKISSSAIVNIPRRIRSSEYQKKRRDRSTQVRDDEKGVVNSVILAHKPNCDIAKVTVRTTRIPEIGDKFSSRHSQKGTVGCVANPEDLPFAMTSGMIPDIVMSPLGITSRMTMGKVIEIILGKASCLSGDIMDSIDDQDFETPFEQRMETITKILTKAGFSSSGKEIFIDGITGNMIKIPVMSGVVSYAKLNHMVSRKAHARATGPVHMLTRQPNEGRRQGGGLRFGPMELECVVAHSAAEILRERTLTAADPFDCYICSQCGNIGDGNVDINYYFCRFCRTGKMIKKVELGFSTKLMTQELMATGIKVKLGVTECDV